jgi:hypothetical protein
MNISTQERVVRTVLWSAGIINLLLAVGFAWQMPWAIVWAPWPDGRLSYLFLGSIFAAIAAPNFWIALSGEFRAVAAGSINLAIVGLGLAWHFHVQAARLGRPALDSYATGALLFALLCIAMYFWSRNRPARDGAPMPRYVRLSFGVFLAALLFASTLLLRHYPTVFPWPLKTETATLIGLIFLGNAAYFLCGILQPARYNATGQLLAFLAYDLVLIPPYMKHFGSVKPEHQLSLVIYMAVLLFSAAVAIRYLWGYLSGHLSARRR